MTFIAESLTSFYDPKEDRLSLIFYGKDKRQLMGLMTRQLFKNLLERLPAWLTQQRADLIPQTTEQQWEINHIQHQISQQQIVVKREKINSNHQFESFLISTLTFTKRDSIDGKQKIKLEFLDSNKTTAIIFILNSSQLHKLIGEMLKQVRPWDIDNPWQKKNPSTVSSNNKILH
jgi:hypothetical protein